MDGVGHFRSDAAHAHFLDVYGSGMSALPPLAALFDLPTSFGTVRVYRFDGPVAGTPVVLLPGRNASTPMWRINLPTLVERRTVFCVDLLGEAGLSVQTRPMTGPGDQAEWLDEALAGLELERAHVMGVSIGGWTATNLAVHHPGRVASLVLLDPVQTFARIPLRTLLISGAMFSPGIPEAWRRRILRWIGGGAPIDDSQPEAALIAASSMDFVLRQPMPKQFTDTQLRSIGVPVLALIAGRSVMLNSEHAAARARRLLPDGQIEVWDDASHAINGEFPERVAERAAAFWGRPAS